jgi:hypothetical protein
MTDNTQARHALGIVVIGMGMAAAICASAAQTSPQPRPLAQFLEENGWVSLPVPDRKMGPGSLIKITQKENAVSVQWLGDFRRCGITDKEFGFVRGKYPAIGVGKTFRVTASVAAGYVAKLHGTADFGKADGALLQIEASGGDVVDLGALAKWLATPSAPRRMPSICHNFLAQDDVYLVSEAFRVSRGVYDLVDKSGAKLAVGGAAFGQIGASSSGTVSVVDDVYFGVRRVRPLAPALFEPNLQPRDVPVVDDLLRLVKP